MIYPEQIPQIKKGHPEETVFNYLKKVSDKYDIFYSRKFIGKDSYERVEYEIDFLIAEPKRAIICLEVKGGLIHFDGITNLWSQNHKPMNKGPDEQATSAAHSLMRRFSEIFQYVPVEWGLCFPDCELQQGVEIGSNFRTVLMLFEVFTQNKNDLCL